MSLVTEMEDLHAELRVNGPVGELDFTLDGVSVFQPVNIPNDTTVTEKAHTIFEFVSKNMPSWNVNSRTNTSGLLFGTGYGMCIDQARVLVALWHRYGIEGRLVTSADHSAAEARIDGTWRFFDPQHHLDHSEKFGSPTSVSDLRALTPPWPFRFDEYGYQTDWLQRTYSGMEPQERVERWLEIQRPSLALKEGESLVIRARSTISKTALPLSPVPLSKLRAGLINTYELQLKHMFGENAETVCFESGLPLIDIQVKPRSIQKVKWQRWDERRLSEISLSNLQQRMLGSVSPLCLHGSPSSTITVSYALAGWIGDRLLRPPTGSQIRILADRPCVAEYISGRNDTIVKLGEVSVVSATGWGQESHARVEIEWKKLEAPTHYQIVVEELASLLLIERLRDLAVFETVLPSNGMSPTGADFINLKWSEPEPWPNRGGSEAIERYLLIRLQGHGVVAGKNHQLIVTKKVGG